MESSNTRHQGYQLKQQNQPNSGLLRFRSAPSSLLSNLTTPSKGNNLWEGPESEERFVSRFVSYGTDSSSNDISASPSFQELEENNKSCSKALSGMNSQQQQQGYGSRLGLPPHYPRHGSAATTTSSSAMDGSFGLVGSLGMDHEVPPHKGFGSHLLRQGSSPAGLFSNNNISFQNGIGFVLVLLCFHFSFDAASSFSCFVFAGCFFLEILMLLFLLLGVESNEY